MANIFNDYFINIGPSLAKKITKSDFHFSHFMPPASQKSLAFWSTDSAEIVKIVASLENSFSTGPDGIPMTVIKPVIHLLAPVLAHLINYSYTLGVFPSAMKKAKVLPIYKSGDHSEVNNYRPISVLNSLSKIYEKIIYRRISEFIVTHNILSTRQFGFRKEHSTSLALVSFMDKLTELIDKGLLVASLFIDLSKAFDTIDHSVLISKLEDYGIRGFPLDLIRDYLNNRFQYVLFKDQASSSERISCGVPQGSILGSLLFILYIYISYCNIVWANTYKSSLAHLLVLQKRALHVILKSRRKIGEKDLFQEAMM